MVPSSGLSRDLLPWVSIEFRDVEMQGVSIKGLVITSLQGQSPAFVLIGQIASGLLLSKNISLVT